MKWIDFPNLRQTFDYDCGAKAMHAILAYYGINTNEYNILRIAHTTPKMGTSLHGMLAVATHFRLGVKIEELSIEKLKKYLDQKIPVILLLQAWSKQKIKKWKNHWSDGHYVVAIGYDKKNIYFEDPYSVLRTYLSYKELEERWHGWGDSQKKKAYHVGMIVKGRKNRYNSTKAVHMD